MSRKYLASLLLVLFASGVGEWVHRALEPTNLVMIYLAVVVVAAAFLGRGPAIVTAFISVVAFDVLFVPPRFSFNVHDTEYLITFAGLLIVGLIISELTSRTREQAIHALEREKHALSLYRLSRTLSNALDIESVLKVAKDHVAEVFQGSHPVFIATDYQLDMEKPGVNDLDVKALNWALEHRQAAGWGTSTFATASMMYLPLCSGQKVLGTLGIRFHAEKARLNQYDRQSLETLANQLALAIERVILAEETRQLELLEEKEKLHTALLNSISHDLRTPLVSITGVLSHLVNDKNLIRNPALKELVETAHEEVNRLNRLVTNWLDMTKVEAGALRISNTPCDLRDVMGVALSHLDDVLEDHPVQVKIPDNLPEVGMDFSLLMKALINILDNAAKYSDSGSPIEIAAEMTGSCMEITISDRGMGIPEEDLIRVFDKFYRAARTVSVSGTGLGLSISRGIIEAYRGAIMVENRAGGGAVFRLTLPVKKTGDL